VDNRIADKTVIIGSQRHAYQNSTGNNVTKIDNDDNCVIHINDATLVMRD